MNDQPIDFLSTYRTSRVGFLLLSLGLVPACLLDVAWLVGRLGDIRLLFLIERSGAMTVVSTLTPWATLAGATVLWGAWDVASWRRRSGLLMTMCLVDVANWFLDLGDPQMAGGHAWFRYQLGVALGWAEFALLASLSGDLLTHLGVDGADESAKSTRSLAAMGAVVWFLLFCETTNFRAGWPLQRNPQFTLHAHLLMMGKEVIQTICLIQVTALAVAATRRLDAEVRAMADDARDPSGLALEGEPDPFGMNREADRLPLL